MKEIFISHINLENNTIQTNEDHSLGVAKRCLEFASEFGLGDWGYILGMLHDKGKERKSFQNYIRTITGYDKTKSWHGEDKSHAFIGAKVLMQELNDLKFLAPILSFPILGHHSGLHDSIDFERQLQKEIPGEINIHSDVDECNCLWGKDVAAFKSLFPSQEKLKSGFHHLVRMMFSTLVDADFLDTESFMNPENAKLRGNKTNLKDLEDCLAKHLDSIKRNAPETKVNDWRNKIQEKCLEKAQCPKGFYSLSVPTGGGKTLSSILWAIKHAIFNNQKRIIVAVPYTTIISQTAKIFSTIFGKENVLEHHSDIDLNSIGDPILRQKTKLATENWDYPIIVTTNVQLLESILHNKVSKCRKLHNIVNSVIIMDEVQSLPLQHLQPILDAINTYNSLFNVSFLFTTASQPAISGELIKWGNNGRSQIKGLSNIKEIIPSDWNLHECMKRASITEIPNRLSYAELTTLIKQHKRVLCIVNTRQDAQLLYKNLRTCENVYHLSRMMCPKHVNDKIEKIKSILNSSNESEIIVISTSLIEAGVDIDFPVVFRQETGLDSILQSAGRCNREGKADLGTTFVFRFEKKPYGNVGRACDARESIPQPFDWFAPETMQKYFMQLYSRTYTFDNSDIAGKLHTPFKWEFESASNEFNLIEDQSISLIVNFEDSMKYVEELKDFGPSYSLNKKLMKYSVNVKRNMIQDLLSKGLVEEIYPGYYFIPDPKQYDTEAGLILESHWTEEILIV